MGDSLLNLPSRGCLVSVSAGTIIGKAPQTYIASHNTEPPDDQKVRTDPTNILIRSLLARKEKDTEAKRKQEAKGKGDKGKRLAEAAAEGGAAKRAAGNGDAGPSRDAQACTYTAQQLRSKTNPELVELCRQRSLVVKGRKDELVNRLLAFQEDQRRPSRGQ